jgi:hypothetical protein
LGSRTTTSGLPLPAPAVKMAKWVGLLATTPSASRPVQGKNSKGTVSWETTYLFWKLISILKMLKKQQKAWVNMGFY